MESYLRFVLIGPIFFQSQKMLFSDVFPLKISKKYFFQSFLQNLWNKGLKFCKPELEPDDRCKTSETSLINWICRKIFASCPLSLKNFFHFRRELSKLENEKFLILFSHLLFVQRTF